MILNFKCTYFFTLCQKERCVTSHNLLKLFLVDTIQYAWKMHLLSYSTFRTTHQNSSQRKETYLINALVFSMVRNILSKLKKSIYIYFTYQMTKLCQKSSTKWKGIKVDTFLNSGNACISNVICKKIINFCFRLMI